MKHFLWPLPFLSFLGGYLLLTTLSKTTTYLVPDLIGLELGSATLLASEKQVTLRVLTTREDADLPHNTIISQTPYNELVKPRQPVFVVVTKKPPLTSMPDVRTKDATTLTALLKKQHIRFASYELMSAEPHAQCIAQFPLPGQPVDGLATVLLSKSIDTPMVIPCFVGAPYEEAQQAISRNNFKVHVTHQGISNIVTEQEPLAGSLVCQQQLETIRLCVG